MGLPELYPRVQQQKHTPCNLTSGSREGSVYIDLAPTLEGREVVSHRPLAKGGSRE